MALRKGTAADGYAPSHSQRREVVVQISEDDSGVFDPMEPGAFFVVGILEFSNVDMDKCRICP